MRNHTGSLSVVAAFLTLGLAISASAQNTPARGNVIVPRSSVARPEDAGLRAHTNLLVFVPDSTQPEQSFSGETPASLACVYKLVPQVSGCSISGTTLVPTGGSGAIAIVDAYDDPNAASDLATFSLTLGLPAANFSVVYASGNQPPQDSTGGWELEESLDIEWAHAMAPNATLFLVEANSNSNRDLYTAESVASSLVASSGGGEVSNSWGGGETSGETSNDSKYFSTSGVVYFASAGDSPGVIYPSASPNVISAGGTAVNRSGGNFTSETAWSSGGGGTSRYELRPSYQSSVSGIVGSRRGTPDFSFDANPNTGVRVYDTIPYEGTVGPWWIVGGTSVSSPSLAGIVNVAGLFATSTNVELTKLYSNLGNSSDLRDITSGSCGTHRAKSGYDLCTGVGSDQGYTGK
jgi:subtilase family serine protease